MHAYEPATPGWQPKKQAKCSMGTLGTFEKEENVAGISPKQWELQVIERSKRVQDAPNMQIQASTAQGNLPYLNISQKEVQPAWRRCL